MLNRSSLMSWFAFVSLVHICVLGTRGKRLSENSKHGRKVHSEVTADGALKFCDTDVGGIVLHPVRGLDEAIHKRWQEGEADPNRVQHSKTSKLHTKSVQVTHDGILVQLVADAYPDRGPECVRISSTPQCAFEGEFAELGDEGSRFKAKATYMPLRHQATPSGDHAIGNWTSPFLTFEITPNPQPQGLPKLTITQKNEDDVADHGEPEEWYGDLSEADERGVRFVTLANPYDGNRDFTVRQLTGNSMEVGFGKKVDAPEFAVRDYEAQNVTLTAFVCGRSTTAHPWVALQGYTWIFESPANRESDFESNLAGAYGPEWQVAEYSNNHHTGVDRGVDAGWRSRSERELRWTRQKPPMIQNSQKHEQGEAQESITQNGQKQARSKQWRTGGSASVIAVVGIFVMVMATVAYKSQKQQAST